MTDEELRVLKELTECGTVYADQFSKEETALLESLQEQGFVKIAWTLTMLGSGAILALKIGEKK